MSQVLVRRRVLIHEADNNTGALCGHFVATIPYLNSVSSEAVQRVLIGATESGSWAVLTNVCGLRKNVLSFLADCLFDFTHGYSNNWDQ